LQDLEGFLLEGGFAGAVAHFGEASLVGGEFGVEFGEFDVDGVDVGVGLREGMGGLDWGRWNGIGGEGDCEGFWGGY